MRIGAGRRAGGRTGGGGRAIGVAVYSGLLVPGRSAVMLKCPMIARFFFLSLLFYLYQKLTRDCIADNC